MKDESWAQTAISDDWFRICWAISEHWDSSNQEKDLSHSDWIYYEYAQTIWHERLHFKVYVYEGKDLTRYWHHWQISLWNWQRTLSTSN